MAPKIKWETDYDDLLFDFIQFRSLHPNGNVTDSIEAYKKEKSETPMAKRYRLKRNIVSMDLTAKAGEIGELNSEGSVWFDNGRYFYPIVKVEQYPEWFEEIKEEQPFQWSDKLVKEMIYEKLPLPNHYAGNVQKCLNEFKASKQQTNTIPSGEKYKQWDIPMNATIANNQSLPFQVGEKVRFGYMGENYEGEIRTAYYFKETALVCYFEDTITKYLEVPFSKLSKVESQPKTERIELRTDDGNVVYTKEQLREAEEKAFNAGRELIPDLVPAPPEYRKYPSYQHYKKHNP